MIVLHIPCLANNTDTVGNSYSSATGTAPTYPVDYTAPLTRSMQFGATASTITYTPQLHQTTKMSIAFWYKCGTLNSGASGSWMPLIILRTHAVNAGEANFRLERHNTTNESYTWYNNGNFTNSSGVGDTATLTTNKWYHMVMSVNLETGYWAKWVTPLGGTTTATTGTITPTQQCYFLNSLIINKMAPFSSANYSDIRVYDHLISDYEVAELVKRPLCHYDFNVPFESMTSGIADITGMGNDAEKIGTLTLDSDTPTGNNSIVFSGSSSYITLPRTCMVEGPFTYNIWAYMGDWTTYSSMRLISSTEGGGWNLEDADNNIRMSCYDGLKKGYVVPSFIAKSTIKSGWHMWTFMFNGSKAQYYLDGQLKGESANYTSAPNGKVGYNANNRIFIGCEAGGNANPAGNYFKGKVSEFRIYASALTTDDLNKLYTQRLNIDNKFGFNINSLQEIASLPHERTLGTQNGITIAYNSESDIYTFTGTSTVAGGFSPFLFIPIDTHVSGKKVTCVLEYVGGTITLSTTSGAAYACPVMDVATSATANVGTRQYTDMGSYPNATAPLVTRSVTLTDASATAMKGVRIWLHTRGASTTYSATVVKFENYQMRIHVFYDSAALPTSFIANSKSVSKMRRVSELGIPVRYLRLNANGSNSNTANHIMKWEVITTDGQTITVASAYTEDHAKIIEGYLSFAASATKPYFNVSSQCTADLGAIYNVAAIRLGRYYDGRYYYQTKLSVSVDKNKFITVWDSHNTGAYAADKSTDIKYQTYVEVADGTLFSVTPDQLYINSPGQVITRQFTEG